MIVQHLKKGVMEVINRGDDGVDDNSSSHQNKMAKLN